MVTDQNPILLAKSIIKERLLDHLPDEVPYNVQVVSLTLVLDDVEILKIVFDSLNCLLISRTSAMTLSAA